MEWSQGVRLTATRNVAIFPTLSGAHGKTPRPKFTVWITAVIHLQVLPWKAAHQKWKISLWVRCGWAVAVRMIAGRVSQALQKWARQHSTENDPLFQRISMHMRFLGIPALTLKPRLCSGNISVIIFTITFHALHCRIYVEWKQSKVHASPWTLILMKDYIDRKTEIIEISCSSRSFYPKQWLKESRRLRMIA